ncbi:MAG TPA: DUF692 family protein [Blastocatellia bacterium]|jgi:uncharacterized protein (UPF0276 family)|nr:DUF692 family protein [Blastocatellia bacterium]
MKFKSAGKKTIRDRVGLGWRGELAVGILSNLDRIDVVEVIADDLFDAPRDERRALRTLAAQTTVVLHGVSLGLASSVPVDAKLLEKTARLCEEVEPEYWSEHLAFVRGGGVEIGHLAAPPRTDATIEGAAANLERARAVVGAAPLVENIATLIDPPGSDYDEIDWINRIIDSSPGDLLLDLHNLHANATNFGYDAAEFLKRLPSERIAAAHLAGGKWVEALGKRRLLDDHLHDVPDVVYQLLTELAALAPNPLTVILERDGAYPPIDTLLRQLDCAREALAEGRSRQFERMEKEAA